MSILGKYQFLILTLKRSIPHLPRDLVTISDVATLS